MFRTVLQRGRGYCFYHYAMRGLIFAVAKFSTSHWGGTLLLLDLLTPCCCLMALLPIVPPQITVTECLFYSVCVIKSLIIIH